MTKTWSRRAKSARRVIGFAVALMAAATAPAQVPPSASEVAAYTGLHAAAQRGDVRSIETAARADRTTTGKSIDARDAYGRTPLHVAAFAKQR